MKEPKVNTEGQKELKKLDDGFNQVLEGRKEYDPFEGLQNVSSPDPQTLLSRKELDRNDALYLRPVRSIPRTNYKNDKVDSRCYFKEEHKKQHERDWEYVKCIVENNEVIGEDIETWTSKWGCDPAHFWRVPVNKPVLIPRLLAEQLAKCKYHRLRTENQVTGHDGIGQTYGALVVDHVVHRINARPVGFDF